MMQGLTRERLYFPSSSPIHVPTKLAGLRGREETEEIYTMWAATATSDCHRWLALTELGSWVPCGVRGKDLRVVSTVQARGGSKDYLAA